MQSDQVWNDFLALPIEAQRQAADFIAFLQQRYRKVEQSTATTKTDLRKEPFVGMWRDRDDIQDSTEWVRDLRKKEWTR
jgi:hypothetical protein